MIDIIELLSRIGSDSNLRYDVNPARLTDSEGVVIEKEIIAAINSGDKESLERILGARSNVVCAIVCPEDEPAEKPANDEPAEQEESIEKQYLKVS